MHKLLFVYLCLFLFGCQPTTLEDFQIEGGALMRALLRDLRKIETREDLPLLEPTLKKDFERIADLMIQARVLQQKNPEMEVSFQHINATLNLSLMEEMRRVYEIEGGRECIERAEKEAMLKLDAKEKQIKRQQSGVSLK